MYRCKDCGFEFLYAEKLSEYHNLSSPPFESIKICPNCKGNNFYEIKIPHCRYCGKTLKHNENEYCTAECRRKGEIMWSQQAKRKNKYEQNSLVRITKELEKYNRKHGSLYTYGIYVAKVLDNK